EEGALMQASMFNVRVPLDQAGQGGDVFLMNTITDAQLIVSRDVAALLDRIGTHGGADGFDDDLDEDARGALDVLTEQGFVVRDRAADRDALDRYFASVTSDGSELHVTVLTTLQC